MLLKVKYLTPPGVNKCQNSCKSRNFHLCWLRFRLEFYRSYFEAWGHLFGTVWTWGDKPGLKLLQTNFERRQGPIWSWKIWIQNRGIFPSNFVKTCLLSKKRQPEWVFRGTCWRQRIRSVRTIEICLLQSWSDKVSGHLYLHVNKAGKSKVFDDLEPQSLQIQIVPHYAPGANKMQTVGNLDFLLDLDLR